MKRMDMPKEEAQIVLMSAYGKKKLLGYADSFRNLAKTFTYREKAGKSAGADRQMHLMHRRLMENREILADNLNEIARIMSSLAEESCRLKPLPEKELKKIVHACKSSGILIQNICRTQDEISGMKLAVELRTDERHVLTAEDAAALLSALFGRRLLPEKDALFFLSKEYETLVFEEEAAFDILTGAAKATRENETVSGDTCCLIEKGNGAYLMAISDGMGSGEKAMSDSESVIDLLEKFVEAGFSKETAAEMINGVLVARSEEENMSTLDVCEINLYTGVCELMKIGASYTYIKRGDMVEQIASDNLPLGIFHRLDLDRQTRQLKDGDYVVMVSDGVVDGVGEEILLREFIAHLQMQNPQEIANYILQFVLHRSMGKVADDMTILVLGIWENTALEEA